MEFKVPAFILFLSLATVLIESDWNLKTRTNTSTRRNLLGINRIRLEFKAKYVYISDNRLTGINRIRLEFKADMERCVCEPLKRINRIRLEFKVFYCLWFQIAYLVLIESDWNLKNIELPWLYSLCCGINRIRLEFKDA